MAVPAETPVTMPALLMVATAGLLLVQVPPVGDIVVVPPIQILLAPVMLAVGVLLTVMAAVGAETQPVAVSVKVKVAVPADTPVTTPALSTVATAALLLAQVPPLVGVKPELAPIQILVAPEIVTTGIAFTVTVAVGAEAHPVRELVKVKVAVPADMPVTTPAFVTVATEALLLAQVPPVEGDNVVVNPTQILAVPVILTTGKALTVTAEVARETQPVPESVKVKVAEPAVTPVTTPASVTVATAGLLLIQVPPVEGDKVVVAPTQIVLAPVILTAGCASKVTAEEVAEQFGEVLLVNVNVAEPADIPVTKPPLVTVAMAGALLTQVPPLVGDKVVVEPTHIVLIPVILTTGSAVTETAPVAAEVQPVDVSVKVKVALPADTPVTTPASVTVATPGALLVQVPPVVGDKVVVAPAQILLVPVMLTTGNGSIVSGVVVAAQPVAVLVKVKVTVPADTELTTPASVTVALEGWLLTQVPPEAGNRVVVAPRQIVLAPLILTTGNAFTVTIAVVALQLGAAVFVKVKVTEPAETAVTRPAFVTDATRGSLLTQVPPMVGDKVVVAPTQIVLDPVILTAGKALTVTAAVGAETQPVVELVNVKVAVPAVTAVTTPERASTVATEGLLLTQVPPKFGDKVVVDPIHILFDPLILTAGAGFTVTSGVDADTQPDPVAVKLKVTEPADTPVTTPASVMVAIAGSLLVQVPPLTGETLVMSPIQILFEPTRLTLGAVTTVIVAEAEFVHPSALLTVTV